MKEHELSSLPVPQYLYALWQGCQMEQRDSFEFRQRRRIIQTRDSYSYKPFDDTGSIFVHIPKCAGVSVANALYGNLAGGHTTFDEYLVTFEPSKILTYFKFTIVRNPWDRLVSAYHFLRQGGFGEEDTAWFAQELSQYSCFDDFVRHWLTRVNVWKWHHFRPQYHYIQEKRHKVKLDFVGYFENLEDDFNFISRRLGRDHPLPTMNCSTHADYQQYYTEKSRRIVAEVYEEDICLFGYTFDNANFPQQLLARDEGRYRNSVTKKDNRFAIPLPELLAKAQQAKKEKDWQQALKLWEACIQGYKQGNQAWWQAEYANALVELGRLEEARQKFHEQTQEFPDFEGGFVGLARIASQCRDWPLAVSCWHTCLTRFDKGGHPWWWAGYANGLAELARYEEAENVYRRLIEEFPDFSAGFSGLASIAQKQQNWQQAAGHWQECLSRFEKDNIWWLRACTHAFIELDRLPEALQVMDSIAGAHENDLHTLELLCRIHFLSGDMDQCLHYAERLMAHHPRSPRGFYWKEEVLIRRGHFAEAADCHLSWPHIPPVSPQPAQLPDNYPADLVLPPIPGNGNDYGFIEEKCQAFAEGGDKFVLAVSIVVPVYNRANMLAKTLAALVQQSYPANLMEVIVADDGSTDHILTIVDKYKKYLNLRYVRQEDLGYRLSAVRNLGIKAATHDHIFLLDGDVLPGSKLIEEGMRYFHVTGQAVLFGLRKFVCSDDFQDDDFLMNPQLIEQLPQITTADPVANWCTEDGLSHDWRIPLLIRSDRLKNEIFPSSLFSGGIVAFPKDVIQEVGYFDEDFKAWGGEDDEFGYRLYNQGYYFIPLNEVSYHQEPSREKGDCQVDRQAGLLLTKPILRQKCPLPSVRKGLPHSAYQVPKVSIFMPVYNVGEFIKDAVDSVLRQTFTDLEVIICDDGSTDDTLGILQEHYSCEPKVRWLAAEHLGIAAASNRAIRLARGMYIGQLDGDDMLEPQAVEMMVDFLDTNNVGAVYSRYCWIDRKGCVVREHYSVDFSRERLLVDMICTAFRMFRKRDWLRTVGYDESLENAEDYDMMLKLSEVCTIAHLSRLTYKYRYHGGNTTLAHHELHKKNHIIAIKKALLRMGLADDWDVVAGPVTDRRKVTFTKRQD